MKEKSKGTDVTKQKKKIIKIMIGLLVFVLIYVGLTYVDFDKLFGKTDEDGGSAPIYFYDESLSKNILQDEKYLEKDRSITFVKTSSGIGETLLDEQDAVEAGPAAKLLYNMLGYILSGNHDGYNSCFSDYYYSNGGEMKGKFTQQKIYKITITEVAVQDKTDENGESYKEYYYTLEYMIMHNNGTLRDDMGSDCIKTQHIYLSERYGDELLIDKLYTINYVEK